ncbi:MAG: hypothetical protein Ct9H90mP3_4020 [Flammeovirgaceae bacterium]|nr:MAG: hypothetical protein Ct9H90mP3_4020 [Flammeovirgaceae bacterium]
MVSGGKFYTLGTVFYARDRMKYNHVIWHVFVWQVRHAIIF